MKTASIEYRKRGYRVTDESAKQPYDLRCVKNGETKYVEVKGTQASGADVVLTTGEVTFIEKNKVNCILCVVHSINVEGIEDPKASGGQISFNEPFDFALGTLKPLAFTFHRGK